MTLPRGLADTLADLSDANTIRTLPDNTVKPFGTVWNDALRTASDLRARAGAGSVGVILTNGFEMSTVLLAAIAAGIHLVSLPAPPPQPEQDWYRRLLAHLCSRQGLTMIVADRDTCADLPPVPVDVVAADELGRGRAPLPGPEPGFCITQYTSGSTSAPKGVPLTEAHLLANTAAITDRLDGVGHEVVCTWLPLSHDMGLIGTFLTTLVGTRLRDVTTELILLKTRHFMWRPNSWLTACHEFGATISASSDFGLQIATRLARRGDYDLSRLHTIIVGAEPIRPETLRNFGDALEPHGLPHTALTPAYGLAEAALGVTMIGPRERWKVFGSTTVEGGEDRISQLVSSGPPLARYQVGVADGDDKLGEVAIAGPSIPARYAEGHPLADGEGWFATGDLGLVADGELYVLGRMRDMFARKGRNVYFLDVEAAVAASGLVRQGRVAAGADDGRFYVLAEAASSSSATQGAARELAAAVQARTGVRPDLVALLRSGAMPLTGSGKPRTADALSLIDSGQIVPLAATCTPNDTDHEPNKPRRVDRE